MSRSAARARTGQNRASLYAEITDKIIAELEAGRLPWVQPWGASGTGAAVGMPKNAATGRRYSGINVLILWGAIIERGYSGQAWLTFRQALGLGGNVRKGERGTTVVYAERFVPEAERERRKVARHGETLRIDLLHRAVPAVQTPDEVRALSKDRPIDPASVERYLRSKFGDGCAAARQAMEELVATLKPADLAGRAYHLYERFRPKIPSGVSGCGAAGDLDLAKIAALAGQE